MNTEELKEAIKEAMSLNGVDFLKIKPLVKLAESVLKVEGLPEKEQCICYEIEEEEGFHCDCGVKAVNNIIDKCKLVIAKSYILKSSLPSVEEVAKIAHDNYFADGWDDCGEVEKQLWVQVSQAIKELIERTKG